MKKVMKTISPFMYDLNQILYDYAVEVTNRFKGLDLVECLKNYGQRFITLYRRQLPKPSPKKDVLFIIEYWNAKVGSQETPGVTGKVGLGIRNEAGQRLTEFCQENTLVIAKTLSSNNTRIDYIHGHHQMVNTESD